MTPHTDPAARLRAGATALRTLADAATPGERHTATFPSDVWIEDYLYVETDSAADAALIAAMGPDMCRAIADLLEDVAEDASEFSDAVSAKLYAPALAVCDLVLGNTP